MHAANGVRHYNWLSALAPALACCLAASIAATGVARAQQVEAPASKTKAAKSDPYQQALQRALSQYRAVNEGDNADYIPALAKVDPRLYGIAIVTVDGNVYEGGDVRETFSIQSAAKPFVLARAMSELGAVAVQKRIGVNQTGQPFNSVLAIELLEDSKRPPAGNPLVNAGAIATVDMLPARSSTAKWQSIADTLNGFAGRLLEVDEEIYRSESETNTHNRAIVALLVDYKIVTGDPAQALDLYTKECSVSVTARDLATMGATLANGGMNPLTGQQVVTPAVAHRVLAVMSTTGLYETSGDWLYEVGVPAKSGVGGGIVAVVPGRFAIGTFAPPLDKAGNSVRGQRAIAAIVEQLGGNIFAGGMRRPPMGARTPAPQPTGAKSAAPQTQAKESAAKAGATKTK